MVTKYVVRLYMGHIMNEQLLSIVAMGMKVMNEQIVSILTMTLEL